MENTKKRIDILDALRGFAVMLMVIHHILYNLVVIFDAPWWLYSNPFFDFLQVIFIGVFVSVSGVSSRFSRSNVDRGAIVLVLAVIIMYVTTRMGMPITFGILHLLGFLMMFYGLTSKLLDKIPRNIAVVIYVSLTVASALARSYFSPSSENPVIKDILSVLGWRQPGFVSYDYQPILPWFFVFLFGTWVGWYIKEGKFPSWFYEKRIPFFPIIGRKALLIYVLHQPILFGATLGVSYFLTR